MKIATIAALALTLALPSLAQQSATKIVTENGQPTLALDEQFAARLRSCLLYTSPSPRDA